MSTFTLFRKKVTQPMRPYVPGEDLSDIFVAPGLIPEEGGMIAMNPQDASSQWYVTKEQFLNEYEMDDGLC